MPAYKDSKTGKWYTSFYYTNWNGVREKKMKRGFETKKAALEWERDFLMKSQANLDMRFDSFVELYIEDLQHRIKENTFKTKNSVTWCHLGTYIFCHLFGDGVSLGDVHFCHLGTCVTWGRTFLSLGDVHFLSSFSSTFLGVTWGRTFFVIFFVNIFELPLLKFLSLVRFV